jgi:hypothetical protein
MNNFIETVLMLLVFAISVAMVTTVVIEAAGTQNAAQAAKVRK